MTTWCGSRDRLGSLLLLLAWYQLLVGYSLRVVAGPVCSLHDVETLEVGSLHYIVEVLDFTGDVFDGAGGGRWCCMSLPVAG